MPDFFNRLLCPFKKLVYFLKPEFLDSWFGSRLLNRDWFLGYYDLRPEKCKHLFIQHFPAFILWRGHGFGLTLFFCSCFIFFFCCIKPGFTIYKGSFPCFQCSFSGFFSFGYRGRRGCRYTDTGRTGNLQVKRVFQLVHPLTDVHKETLDGGFDKVNFALQVLEFDFRIIF